MLQYMVKDATRVPGLREAKKEYKRKRILKAAIRLFAKKGFDQTSIADITLYAKVAKGTFYSFFKKKGDVLLYFLDTEIETCRQEIQSSVSSRVRIIDQLELLIIAYLKYIFRNKEFARVLAKERFETIGTRTNKNELRMIKSISQLIDRAKERKEIKKSVDSRCMADMIFAIYTIYVIYWLNGFIKSKNECVRRIKDIVLLIFEGVGAD
jgi:TetR/AcrR family transcriptional regulator, fatty acid metabolism regulator protein